MSAFKEVLKEFESFPNRKDYVVMSIEDYTFLPERALYVGRERRGTHDLRILDRDLDEIDLGPWDCKVLLEKKKNEEDI